MSLASVRMLPVVCLVSLLGAPGAIAGEPEGTLADTGDPPSNRISIVVRGFSFQGNTVFSSEQLGVLLKPFVGRPVSDDQLEDARQVLTKHYINHGYINSGAVLPDQSIRDGMVRFHIVEGVLSKVMVRGNERIKTSYVQKRIEQNQHKPLNITDLRDRLEIIRQDPNIARINAELKPAPLPGDSYLDVLIQEDNPFQISIGFNNNRSASLGAERLELRFSHTNLTGYGDALHVDYGITEGGFDDMDFANDDDVSVAYSLPLNESDLKLNLRWAKSDTEVLEEPFDTLDISSQSETFEIGLGVPVYQTPHSTFTVSASLERSTNKTFLLGSPFSLSPGAQNGVTKVTTLRLTQAYATRSQRSAWAVRSTFSLGLGLLDATENTPSLADAKFVAWLGQFQHVQRLGNSRNQLVIRVNTQLTDDPLLSMEQFSIGGVDTVRGYRENQLVRDKGIVASIEVRIPLLFDTSGVGVLHLVPFFDTGLGKSINDPEGSLEISSAGVGVLLDLHDRVHGELYWGHPFRDFDNSNDNLQDQGIHFRIVVDAF